MTKVYNLKQIKQVANKLDFSEVIEAGFIAYSRGKVVVPPVGELIFKNPPGDTHIKYGYIKEDDYFVIKIASGFYENAKLGLSSNSGLMLVFSQKTGVLDTILLDEGYLTDIRTAVAGQIVAKYLAPGAISGIGVFGTGIQARMQIQFLKSVTNCKLVMTWGRSEKSLEKFQQEMEADGYRVQTTLDANTLCKACNLIITATPSQNPLIKASQIQPGTHITAMGSDTSEKQELDSEILKNADIVVADSIQQCLGQGEIFKAVQAGCLGKDKIHELGNLINNPALVRQSDSQVTVADLTGVAVQDIQIAKAVCKALDKK